MRMPRRPPESTARLEAGSTSAGNSTTQKGRVARVCFVEYEHNFLIVSFRVPSETDWHKRKDGPSYFARPMASSFTRYKNGVQSESSSVGIIWQKIGEDGDWYAEELKRRRRWFAQFPFGVSPSSLRPVRRRVQRGSGGSLGRGH
jgi:hypothetical protein